jgi:hypothetical protein
MSQQIPDKDYLSHIVEIHKTISDNQHHIREELDKTRDLLREDLKNLKEDMFKRLEPLEKKVEGHDHTINFANRLTTWIGLPSGATLLGFLYWIFTQHK